MDEALPGVSGSHSNDFSLEGRTAVVTGGGRGIGAAIAHELARRGAAVVVSARSIDDVSSVAAAITAAGGIAHAVACDVTKEESVAALQWAAIERFGVVDILINNAGTGHSALIPRTTLEDWNRLMAVNATGAFLCTRAFLPGMTAQGWGRIVNVASVAGLTGLRYIAAYTASKHALVGLTRATAAEVDGSGVTANALCPTFVDTPMTEQTVANVAAQTGRSREDSLASVLATTGQTRLVSPLEVAQAAVELCAEFKSTTNGASIVLDGGAGGV